MGAPAKTKQDQTTHEHTSKTSKWCKRSKKPMSIPAKTQKDQKTHEHSSENEQGVQTHQKTHEHSSKNTKRSKNP